MVSLMANNCESFHGMYLTYSYHSNIDVMTWRVYALWGHSKNALRILWVGFILAYGTTITLNLYNITRFFGTFACSPSLDR